ncbi:uncharacterized protein KY384_001352 [Bacidia gigantensis]|uniref:uncharacterized protein n=1 Tax=Bacidia gigantensis TaxID=2732470 RepID=UPI001D03F5AC|nr:uncharacterized protein KY384_001352 [Bacidia gigantensis]KAG8533612.1 hypothetical protein KY384_001352 [Bacidia gigantensis]
MAESNGTVNGNGTHKAHGANPSKDQNTDPSYIVPLHLPGSHSTPGPTTFPVISPKTSTTIWHSASASVPHANAAISSASTAFPSWRASSPQTRRSIFLKAAHIMQTRSSELESYMIEETGAEPSFAAFNTTTSIAFLEDVAGRLLSILTTTSPICQDPTRRALILKEPFGVTLGIAPWNAPYILGIRAALSALAGGNTVVLKGSELSPRCFWAIGSIFREAGLPDGVLSVIYTRPEEAAAVTNALIAHAAVRKVSFTGSTAIGRVIAEQCGRELKPCLLELGGKAPAIVCADADLEVAGREVVLGALLHSGQICMSTERVLVQEGVVEEFKKVVREKVEQMFGGVEGMVLVGSKGVEKNRSLVKDALGKGARYVIGALEEEKGEVTRMKPIILDGVGEEMEIYRTESFGPTLSILTYQDEVEAVKIANDSEYGLNSAVFTRDLAKAIRLAGQIEAGAVHINSMSVHDEPNLPHGGVKKSGWGRFNTDKGIEEFLVTKTVTWKE